MNRFDKKYNEFMNETKKWAKDINPKKGEMHDLLNIPRDKKISDVYTSGEKLAKDLVKALGGDQKKAASKLALPANANADKDIFDTALAALKKF